MSQPGSTPIASPMGNRTDSSTGTLKTTIMLGVRPSVVPGGGASLFYLVRNNDTIEESDMSGSLNLLEYHQLETAYQKMTLSKRPKEELSSFLPNLPGFLDTPAWEDKSSLRELWENPPRAHKEIELLPQSLLNGFRLRPGSLPEKYRLMDIGAMKKLHKKKRKKDDTNGQDGEASPDAKKARNDKEDDRRSKRREKKRKRRDEEPGSA